MKVNQFFPAKPLCKLSSKQSPSIPDLQKLLAAGYLDIGNSFANCGLLQELSLVI
jgi:hypothetical protein